MRKAIGSKAGIPTKKGTWGGSYQIEVNKHPSTISCYTCTKYVEEGKSCRHYGMFIPVLGKNSWRTCKNFKLDLNYASEDNISYVKKVKGLGFVEEEKTSIKEIKKDAQKDNNKKKTHKEKTKIVKKKKFPSLLMENIVLICLNKHLQPIDMLKQAFRVVEKGNLGIITFDCFIQSAFKNYFERYEDDFDFLSKVVYQLSVQLNCSVFEILSMSKQKRKDIAKKFLDDKRFDTKENWRGEYYYLLPDNKTMEECMELCFNEGLDLCDTYDYWNKGIDFPVYFNSTDNVERDENGKILSEDSRCIIYFNSYGEYDEDYKYDLEYSFPVYFQQEYMEYSKKRDVCSQCNKSFLKVDDYFIDRHYKKWKCPNCLTVNDIYEKYFFKQLYWPQDDEFDI